MEIQNDGHGVMKVSPGGAWDTSTGRQAAQMAPGITEKFIIRINKDRPGTLKPPVQGVERGEHLQ